VVLDGEAEVDGGGTIGEALLADGLEEFGAVAEEELWSGDGVPEDVAEAAEGYRDGGGCGWGGASQSVSRAWDSAAPRRSRRAALAGRVPE
jgi:hypothetical protein